MLMESEHSMAREDKEGSGTVMEFMALPPVYLGKVIGGYENPRSRGSRFSLTAGFHEWAKDMMVVVFVPIVPNTAAHDEVQNLGLTLLNHR
jgi:hypothetical protein